MSDAIRILQVMPQLGRGGAERQLVQMLPRFDADRFRHAVLYYWDSPDSQASQIRDAGCPTYFVDKAGLSTRRFFAALRRAIREFSPDIVHTWMYSGNFWGRLAARSCGIRRCIPSYRAEEERSTLALRIYERLFRKHSVHVANSATIAETMERHLHIPARTVRVIPNGVSCSPLEHEKHRHAIRDELGLPPDEFIVLMLGRQTVEKNYPMFIRAGAEMARKHKHVTFLGVGRYLNHEELQAQIDELGADEGMRLIPQQDEVVPWLQAADVCCLTSDREGFPNVVLEAMASARPVICTNFAATREIKGLSEAGIVVPRDDDRALVRAVESLMDDPERREEMGRRGRAIVQQEYSWEKLVERMEALYEEVYARRV